MKFFLYPFLLISSTLYLSSGSEMTNFSDIVTVFESCLVELINYEGVDLIQNSDVKVPLILIRSVVFTVQSSDDKPFYMFYPYEYASRPEREAFDASEERNIIIPYRDISTRTKFQWKCFARLFFLPPMPDLTRKSEFDEYLDASKFYTMYERYHVKCKNNWTHPYLQHVS